MSLFSKAKAAAKSTVKTAANVAAHPVSTAVAVATHPDQVVTSIVTAAATGSKDAAKFVKGTALKAVRGDKLAKQALIELGKAAKELLPYVPASGDIADGARLLDLDKRARQVLDSAGPRIVADSLARSGLGDPSQIPQRAVSLVKSSMPSESFIARYAPIGAGVVAGITTGPEAALPAYYGTKAALGSRGA